MIAAKRIAVTHLLQKNLVVVFGGRQIWDPVVANTIGEGGLAEGQLLWTRGSSGFPHVGRCLVCNLLINLLGVK